MRFLFKDRLSIFEAIMINLASINMYIGNFIIAILVLIFTAIISNLYGWRYRW